MSETIMEETGGDAAAGETQWQWMDDVELDGRSGRLRIAYLGR